MIQKNIYVIKILLLLLIVVNVSFAKSIKPISKEAKTYGYEGHILLQKGQYSKARKKLEKAQSLGDIRAMHTLGLMYIRGDGGSKSYNKAMYFFKKSYKNGYINAAYDIGAMYKNAEGVKQNFKLAKKYYLIAANNNYKIAQYELAKLYAHEGNKKKEKYWLKRAKKK